VDGSNLEALHNELTRLIQETADQRSRLHALSDEAALWKAQAEASSRELKEMVEANSKLSDAAGHMNPKQRIHLHRMIKEECNTLRMQLTETRVALNNANREIARMKEDKEEREKMDKASLAARQQQAVFSLANLRPLLRAATHKRTRSASVAPAAVVAASHSRSGSAGSQAEMESKSGKDIKEKEKDKHTATASVGAKSQAEEAAESVVSRMALAAAEPSEKSKTKAADGDGDFAMGSENVNPQNKLQERAIANKKPASQPRVPLTPIKQ